MSGIGSAPEHTLFDLASMPHKHGKWSACRREPPVTSAIFPSSFLDVVFLLFRQFSRLVDPLADVGFGENSEGNCPSLKTANIVLIRRPNTAGGLTEHE